MTANKITNVLSLKASAQGIAKEPDSPRPIHMNVISIQSQVAFGHVGNSAAVFPMQMHGIDVIAVPTTLLSNRPGYPTIRGRVLEAQLVADLLLGIEERGAVDACDMILSAISARRYRHRGRKFRRACQSAQLQPALLLRSRARGSRRGLFVQADIPPLVRDRLCPLADIITPNHFEFDTLAGASAGTTAEMIALAQTLLGRGPSTVVITSAELSDTRRRDRDRCCRAIPKLARAYAKAADQPVRHRRSLCLAVRCRTRSGKDTRRALGHAASAIYAVLERTAAAGTEEMRIVASENSSFARRAGSRRQRSAHRSNH